MKLASFEWIVEGQRVPTALLLSAALKDSRYPTDAALIGIQLPIPWIMERYLHERQSTYKGHWWLCITISVDHMPTLIGKLPSISFNHWLEPICIKDKRLKNGLRG